MRELRIRLATSRSAPRADHLWRFADGAPGSERPWSGGLPEADRYCVFVPPERAMLVELTPPPMSARRLGQAIPWLLEGQLIEAVEHYEIVRLPAADAEDGRLRLLVLEKDWLAEVRRQLTLIGEGEVDWLLAGSQWRLPASTWAIRGDGARALISLGDGRVLAVGDEGVAATMQALLAEGGESQGGKPSTLWHAGISPAAQEALAAVASEMGVTLAGAELPDEFDADTESATVLFRQRRSALRRALGGLADLSVWRAAAMVLALLVGLEVLAPMLRWGQLALEESRLRAASAETFRSIAGARAVVVDPWLQMRRLDQERQHARGLPVADDFLPLIDAISVLVPASAAPAAEIRYADRAVEMVFAGDSAAGGWLPDAQAALEAKGWRAQVLRDGEGRSRLTLRVSAW